MSRFRKKHNLRFSVGNRKLCFFRNSPLRHAIALRGKSTALRKTTTALVSLGSFFFYIEQIYMSERGLQVFLIRDL